MSKETYQVSKETYQEKSLPGLDMEVQMSTETYEVSKETYQEKSLPGWTWSTTLLHGAVRMFCNSRKCWTLSTPIFPAERKLLVQELSHSKYYPMAIEIVQKWCAAYSLHFFSSGFLLFLSFLSSLFSFFLLSFPFSLLFFIIVTTPKKCRKSQKVSGCSKSPPRENYSLSPQT
jgi:hypothetical protein